MIPGSQEFRAALLSALSRAPVLRDLGPPEIHEEERWSRNTVIYRCRAGSTRLVAKAQLTKPPEVAAAEYRILREMEGTFGDGKVRALKPIALLEDLGVLVTEEEEGESLRSLIEQGLDSPEPAVKRARSGVKAAANALRRFHDLSVGGMSANPRANDNVRCYLDFSSKNILVRWRSPDAAEPELVLMDPPEEEKWGDRTEDLGVFCFDLARIRFAPRFIWRPSVSRRLDRLKACFIRGYFGRLEPIDLERALRQIALVERRRARQTLVWYLRPWRYDRMFKEVARLLYLGPLTLAYLVGGSHLSAVRVRTFIRDSREPPE